MKKFNLFTKKCSIFFKTRWIFTNILQIKFTKEKTAKKKKTIYQKNKNQYSKYE